MSLGMRLIGGGALLALMLCGPMAPGERAIAKDGGGETVPLPPRPPPGLDRATTADESQIDRLAELMGTLAFLRDLCGEHDGATWRGRMDDLIQAEGTTAARRDRLAGSYNRGYTGYQFVYHGCTPAAEVVIARALSDGARIASEITARYDGPQQSATTRPR